jgi:hypothetical protein
MRRINFLAVSWMISSGAGSAKPSRTSVMSGFPPFVSPSCVSIRSGPQTESRWVAPIQRFMTTVSPAASAILRASSETIPS